jgi:hypothetical protein
MKTNVFYSKLSSAKLQESLEKQFGARINLNKYDREQLEDIRNKLRTRIFQQEGSAGINDLLTNETYQKDKAMLELLNTRIKEMLGEQMKQLRDKMDQLTEAKKAKGDGNLANNAKPYDKVTQGDVIAGRLGKDEKGGKKADKAGKPFQEAAKKMCAKCKKPAATCKCAVEEGIFNDIKTNWAAGKLIGMINNLKRSIPPEHHNLYDIDSVKSIDDAKRIVQRAKLHGHMKEGYELDEGFDDMEKANAERHAAEKRAKGTDKFDKKNTTTGTVYTKKATKDQPEPEEKKSKKVKEAYNPNSPDAQQGRELRAHREKELQKKAAAGDERAKATLARMAREKAADDQAYADRMERESVAETKPSAGMSAKEKSAVVKKAKAGGDIGKPGKGFAKVEKAAAKSGARDPKAVAAAAMWKQQAKESRSVFKQNVKFVNESIEFFLMEDEEAKAKAITAAGDMVNDFTSWMQRVGQYQTKAIIELADEIRSEFGAAEAEAFKQSVAPALSATLETLTQQREAISNAVATLAGEAGAEEPMGMEPDMGGQEPGMDLSAPDEMNPTPAGDEFGASDAAAGGDETSGREMRESRAQQRARKLSESHSIMSKLAR